jgi:hypothetical protein
VRPMMASRPKDPPTRQASADRHSRGIRDIDGLWKGRQERAASRGQFLDFLDQRVRHGSLGDFPHFEPIALVRLPRNAEEPHNHGRPLRPERGCTPELQIALQRRRLGQYKHPRWEKLPVRRHTGRLCSRAWVLAVFLAGCGDPPTAPPATPSEPTWRLIATGEPLVDVWGLSPTAVYALGSSSLLFYNGSNWTALPDPPHGSRAIWGTSPEDLFVVADGDVYHYDGHTWDVVLDGPTPQYPLFDIWGSSDHDIFVAGGAGIILHYDGSAWSQMLIGITNRCLWGTSSHDVYAAGSGGSVLHYDGSTWTSMSTGNFWELSGIWATSSSDIYCVGVDGTSGYEGTVFHYDGSSWRPVAHADRRLWNVWGSSSTDVFAVGDGTTVLHYDGVAWSRIPTGPVWAGSIWGSSSHDVFIVGGDGNFLDQTVEGGSILHCDGTAWTQQARSLTHTIDIAGVGGSSATDVYFVGGVRDVYPSIQHFDGSTFDAGVSLQGEGYWQDVWGAAPDAVWVVGDDRVDLFDGSFSGWTREYAPPGSEWAFDNGVYSVWATSRDNAFVAGVFGTVFHFDGSTWTPMTTGTTSHLSDIWGSSDTDIFAVGTAGTVIHYDGSSWTLMPKVADNTLLGVWGSSSTDVYAVGDAGTILHYDGVQWKDVPSMTQNRLTGVWGSSDRDVFVVGGIILHYDGKAWTTMTNGGGAYKVWGSGKDDVYVTEVNRILHYGH